MVLCNMKGQSDGRVIDTMYKAQVRFISLSQATGALVMLSVE